MSPRKTPKDLRSRFLDELDPVLDSLHRAALRMTTDATRAEDVLQESILKGYRFFPTYKEGTNFRAWMHRVLFTVFVNTTRDRGPRSSTLEAVPEPEENERPLVEELDRPTHVQRAVAVMESVDERIKQAVQDLPSDLRMVFMLSTIEGLKYREIAEVMQCPLGTVMSRLFRSRRMLQERLFEYAREGGFDTETASPDGADHEGARS